ncbi:MAG: ribonuclease Z [Thaumarchaeota archaeon]|nr:ribonuclease Z [Nitrososphaerota archaeon]
MVDLTIVFLGTSSAVPTKERGLSCIAIRRGPELMVFDAGEGAQRNLLNAKVGVNRETKIFVTHMHGDHSIGLLGILQSMAMYDRSRPVRVFGPKGIVEFVKRNREILGFGLTYELIVKEVKAGIIVRTDEYAIKACQGMHTTINYAYLLEEFPRGGVFYPEKAVKLGIPKERWGILQHGKKIKIKGKTFKPSDVMGHQRPSRKIGISGDTRPTEKLVKFFRGADLLIFDSTFSEKHSELAIERYHSTAREAAQLAKKAQVKKLVLTHFSSRYKDVSSLVEEAREVHPDTIAADDMMRINVPYPDEVQASR